MNWMKNYNISCTNLSRNSSDDDSFKKGILDCNKKITAEFSAGLE